MSPSFPHSLAFAAIMITAAALRAAEAAYPDPQSLPANASLPDALVAADGQRVTTREAWQEKRAPELRRLFQHYEYGAWPEAAKVTANVTRDVTGDITRDYDVRPGHDLTRSPGTVAQRVT